MLKLVRDVSNQTQRANQDFLKADCTVHLCSHSEMTDFIVKSGGGWKPRWLWTTKWRGRDSAAQFEVSWTSIAFHTSPTHHATFDYIFSMQTNNCQFFYKKKKARLWRVGCNQRRRMTRNWWPLSCEMLNPGFPSTPYLLFSYSTSRGYGIRISYPSISACCMGNMSTSNLSAVFKPRWASLVRQLFPKLGWLIIILYPRNSLSLER